MSREEIIQIITENIYPNGNNEITANVLNPVLGTMVNQINDITGDLEELNTSDTSNLVNAINSVISDFEGSDSNSVKLHTGTENPNSIPPLDYTTADFYIQQDEIGNPLQLWQYNGLTWVSSNRQPDDFLTEGTITADGNEITVSTGFSWRISDTLYSNDLAQEFEIQSAGTGNSRIDIIVTNGNEFQLIEGNVSEGEGTAVQPLIPIGSLVLTTITIYEDNVQDITPPVVGTQFITKISRRDFKVYDTGSDVVLNFNIQYGYVGYLFLDNILSVDRVEGFAGTGEAYPILGDLYYFVNQKPDETPLTLNNGFFINLGSIDLTVPFGSVAVYRYENDGMRFVSLSDNLNGFIKLSGTDEGSPITGDLEFQNFKNINWIDDSGFINKLSFEDNVLQINRFDSENNLLSSIALNDFKGILGSEEFDKQGDRKAFAQLSDIIDSQQTLQEVTESGATTNIPIISTVPGAEGFAFSAITGAGKIRATYGVFGELNSNVLLSTTNGRVFEDVTAGWSSNSKITYSNSAPTTFTEKDLTTKEFQDVALALKANLAGGNTFTGGNQTVNGKIFIIDNSIGDVPTLGTDWGKLKLANELGAYGAMGGVRGNGNTVFQGQRMDGGTSIYDIEFQPLGGSVIFGASIFLGKFTTVTEPAYQNGSVFFNTSKNRPVFGGNGVKEVVQATGDTGWAVYTDTVYTSGSPFTVNTGATDTLPNNAGTIINNQIPTGVTSFYNPATLKITPQNDGDYYVSTIRFKAQTTAPTSGYMDFGIDIGGALGVQFRETKVFAKGAGIEHSFSIVVPMFTAVTFIANGGLVKITAGNGNITIYDITYQIDRTHKAK